MYIDKLSVNGPGNGVTEGPCVDRPSVTGLMVLML